MKLTRVTITGADDTTKIEDLVSLSSQFPFVEWGILMGNADRDGTEKYPGEMWRQSFAQTLLVEYDMHAAAHLCGYKVQEFLESGSYTNAGNYERIQLNVREITVEMAQLVKRRAEDNEVYREFEDIILPLKYSTDGIWEAFHPIPNITYLFDQSGGRGVRPTFRRPIAGVRCGYAGGIGPEDIDEVLKHLAFLVERGFIWIDMESRVRTNGQLDLDKVQTVLKAANQYTYEL